MRILILSLLVVTEFPPAVTSQVTRTEIRAGALPASVELAPRPDADRLLQLPTLEFELRIEAACEGETKPRSLSISAADTRLHFAADQLAGTAILEATLTLPPNQLAPVKIDGFCHSGDVAGPAGFVLEDAYTARLSLRCGLQERESIVYATLPLDVALSCRRTDAAPSAPDQDSGFSEPFESF